MADDGNNKAKSGFSRNLVFGMLTVAFSTSFAFGWNSSVLNQPYVFIGNWYNETYGSRLGDGQYPSPMWITVMWSVTNALFVVGLIVGSLIAGACADSFSRKYTIMLAQAFLVVGVILATVAKTASSPELLIIGRILIGIMCGMGNCIAPMFLAEIATPSVRGSVCTSHQLLITFGIFFASVIGLPQALCTEKLWPFLQIICLLSAIIALAILPFIPETPSYLLLFKNKEEEARKSLKFYRQTDDVDDELSKLLSEREAKKVIDKQHAFTIRDLFSKRYRRPFFIAMMLQVIQQFSGVNAIFFFSASIYLKAGVGQDDIPYAVLGTNAVNFVMTIVAVPMIEIAGRRKLLILPMSIMIADLVLLVVMMAIQDRHTWASYVSIVCILIYVITFAIGLGPIPWMIGSELFQQRARALAMSACGIMNYVGQFVILIAFEPLQKAIGCYVFVIFIVLLVFFLIFVILLIPETRNKTFEMISKELNSKVSEAGLQ